MSFGSPPTPAPVVMPQAPAPAPQLAPATQKPARKGMPPTTLTGMFPTQQQAPGKTLLGGTTA